MTAKVILNPYSNRWNAKQRIAEAEQALRSAGISYQLVFSERAGHIPELAGQAAREGFSPIIVAGGDGSIGEAINGLAHITPEGEPLPLVGILPLGTGNDLVFSLKLPLGLEAAARIIAAGKVGRMDLGKVNQRYFVNNSGLGLEPYISTIQERIGWIRGSARYIVATLGGIMAAPFWNARMEWDDGSYEGRVSLITICNGMRSGGAFFMGPHASLFDGKLDIVYGYRKTRLSMLQLMPKTMKAGKGNYTESPGVFERQVSWLKVQLDRPTPSHTDGELFTRSIQNLEYRVQPGRAQILVP